MSCEHCTDPDGERIFPYYGLAPHEHLYVNGRVVLGSTVFDSKETWPKNFMPDEDDDYAGTYTHCLKCGE